MNYRQLLEAKINVLRGVGSDTSEYEAELERIKAGPEWVIDNWLPMGHRGMLTGPEGSFKTVWKCWTSTCIASESPILGCGVKRGPVLIVDEETPEVSLKQHLRRFAQGLGYDLEELPIKVLAMTGFRFGRKKELNRLLSVVEEIQPVFTSLDSLIAMMPGGRERIVENDSFIGETIRDELNKVLAVSPASSLLLVAHAKKPVSDFNIEELRASDMQTLVRGHGSIVGEGCDTGYVLKKVSEYPDPTRFAVITKTRRQAIPMSGKVVYVEMKEESYGQGWARLEEIPSEVIPPSKFAISLCQLFRDEKPHKSQEIVREFAFFTRKESFSGVEELLHRKVIVNSSKQTYVINPRLDKECNREYWRALTRESKRGSL